MPTATLTTQGQVTIPKKIRDYLQLHSGDKLEFFIQDDGIVSVRPMVARVVELAGILYQSDRKPATVEDMNLAIRERAGRLSAP